MQAPKNGFFYMLDAKSGELLFCRGLCAGRELGAGHRPQDRSANHQSGSQLRQDRQGCAGQPLLRRRAQLAAAVVSSGTGLVYIPANQSSYAYVATREDDNPMGQKLSFSFAGNQQMMSRIRKPPVSEGFLLAWDPVKQKEAWRVPLGSGRSGGTLRDGWRTGICRQLRQ